MAVPPGVVTTTDTGPVELAAGTTARIRVALTTVNDVTAVPPKVTAVAPVKFVPTIPTSLPPASGPWPEVSPVIVTVAGSTYVYALSAVAVPLGEVTTTLTVPKDPAGA